MGKTDPKQLVAGSKLILDEQGNWPNFHDAEISDLKIWCGDVRPEDNVYIGPQITLQMKLCALEHPFSVRFRFEDCESIEISGFSNQNPIMDLVFGVEERGRLNDGTPMTPYITVHFLPAWRFELSFRCFRAAVERIMHDKIAR